MEKELYNFSLLKQKRIELGLSASDVAYKLCLAERQIISIEENKSDYFPSNTLKMVCIKRYAKALDLHPEDVVIPNLNDVDPTPSLLKKG
jgi:cytoskeletal protein RodZ